MKTLEEAEARIKVLEQVVRVLAERAGLKEKDIPRDPMSTVIQDPYIKALVGK